MAMNPLISETKDKAMADVITEKPTLPAIRIFRPGTFTDIEGQTVTFTSADLAEMISSYDAERDPAPIVLGHPKSDLPAYGWIGSLAFDGDYVVAQPSEMVPGFADVVRNGYYRKVSASFYPPTNPGNPAPGKFYLKHVGFLGALAPAVKGLGTVSFSEVVSAAAVTIVAERPAGSLAARAVLLQAERPEMSFAAALGHVRHADDFISLAEQSSDPITAARVAIVGRAVQLRMATPTLSFGEAMATARKESLLADLAEEAAAQR